MPKMTQLLYLIHLVQSSTDILCFLYTYYSYRNQSANFLEEPDDGFLEFVALNICAALICAILGPTHFKFIG